MYLPSYIWGSFCMTKSSLIMVVTAVSLLSACSEVPPSSGAYPLSRDDAVAKLLEADPKVVFMGSEKGTVSSPANNVVAWTVIDDHMVAQCTAKVAETGENESMVETGCTASSPISGAAIDVATDMFKVMLDEHVASTLLGRPFDAKKAEMASVAAVTRNLPALRASAKQMEAEFQASQKVAAEAAESEQDMIIGEVEDTSAE